MGTGLSCGHQNGSLRSPSERISGVNVASQEEALSTGKARGTPGSCHHSKSPPDVSVHSRGTCFPCTALTFKPRIDSHHVCTWDSPVGNPQGESLVGKTRGKTIDPLIHAAECVTLLLPLWRKVHVHSSIRDEDLLPWGDSRRTPKSMTAVERNPQVPGPTPHKVLGPSIDGRGIPRGPRGTRMGIGLS
ncbi:hypothetical protein MJG53_000350 [Ovis ammon polii x Ovis aries]|nr:hypothetical protein MJG53_000350 [Ovis ammon polii x Ovis aries]